MELWEISGAGEAGFSRLKEKIPCGILTCLIEIRFLPKTSSYPLTSTSSMGFLFFVAGSGANVRALRKKPEERA